MSINSMGIATPAEVLCTRHLLNDLKKITLRGSTVTIAAQAVKLLLQTISIVVLARILNPSDFGLVAIATILTGFISIFKDAGLSIATIQSSEITNKQVSNLYWLNLLVGLCLSLFIVALAPFVARFYGEPNLTGILFLISICFLLDGATVQFQAILRRQMKFRKLAMIDVASTALGIMLAILAASQGGSYWALVVLTVGTTLARTVAVRISCKWRPEWFTRKSGARPLITFGIKLTAANAVGYLTTNLTPFLVGLLGGTQLLGFYNRANILTSMPSTQILSPIMSVAQPALSRVSGDAERFRRATLSLVRKVLFATAFLAVTTMLTADWAVSVLLGGAWEQAVPIVRTLSVFTVIEPLASILMGCLIASGRANAVLTWKSISLLMVLASVGIGSIWGAEGIIAAYAISGLFLRLPMFVLFATRYLPISYADIARSVLPYLLLAIPLSAVLSLLRIILVAHPASTNLLITIPCAFFTYLGCAVALKRTRTELLEMGAMLASVTGLPSARRL